MADAAAKSAAYCEFVGFAVKFMMFSLNLYAGNYRLVDFIWYAAKCGRLNKAH